MPLCKRLPLLEVGVEPSDGAADAVAAMFRLDEHVAFVFVDDELGFDVQRFQRVPEFVGLRRRAFAVTIADDN